MKSLTTFSCLLFFILLFISLAIPANAQVQIGNDIYGGGFNGKTAIATNGDGTRVAIGQRFHSNAAGENVGIVRVYDWNGTDWVQLGADIVGEDEDSLFGTVLDLSADGVFLTVGQPDSDDYRVDAGEVRLYVWTGTIWNTSAFSGFSLNNFQPGSHMGHDVARADDVDRIIVGMPGKEANPNITTDTRHGGIRVYEFDPSVGYQLLIGQNFDTPTGTVAFREVGWSVDISNDGEVFAFGSRSAGKVSVMTFVPNPGTPYDGAYVSIGSDIVRPGGDITWGREIALSGDGQRIVITHEDGEEVHTYDFNGTDWVPVGTVITGFTSTRYS